VSVGKTLVHYCFPVAKGSFPIFMQRPPSLPLPPPARPRAHLLNNFPLEKGSKGAPARGRWVAELTRRGERRRRCAKERKQIFFIEFFIQKKPISLLNFI